MMDAYPPSGGALLRIGDFLVDPARGVVSGDVGETHVEPKVMDVLCALAEHRGDVLSRADLINAIWNVDFGADESLTRAISILRKTFGDGRYIETIPKRGYRLAAPVILIESEPREDNQAGAEEAASKTSIAPPRPHVRPVRAVLLAVAIIAALAAVAVVAFWRDARVVRTVAPNGRVEVRAFDLLADNAEARRFAGGLRDALTRVLAMSRIETASRAFVMPGAGDARSAEFALNGSVDWDGDRYVVAVHIDDQQHGLTLWSWQFERPVNEKTTLQNQIAGKVAGVLRCALTERASQAGDMSAQIFALFLQTCGYLGDFGGEGIVQLHESARRLVEAAPDLSRSHSLFATASAFMARLEAFSEEEAQAFRTTARESAARALELDPENGEAYYALAVAAPTGPGHWAEIKSYLRKSQELEPDFPLALFELVMIARGGGRIGEAIDLDRRAIAYYPYDARGRPMLAWLLAAQNALGEADVELARAEELWPDMEALADYRLQIALWYRPPKVAEQMLDDEQAAPRWLTSSDIACHKAHLDARAKGSPAKSDKIRDTCADADPSYLARILASLGDVDGAYREVERVGFDGYGGTIFLFMPQMREFRRDPRFMPLAARIGLVDYWLTTDEWPDFCDEPDLPYDCKEAAMAAAAVEH